MKKLIVIIFIIFGAFLTFSLYRTFAYDTSVVEETPSTTDLEYTFKIGNSSIKQITVDSGETKYYDVVLGNPNPAKISYSIYYEMVSPTTKPDNFKIEYTSKSTGESTGKVDKEGNITLNLVVTNTSSSAVTVEIGSVAGYVNGGELILGSGQAVIPKKPIPKATELVEELNDNSTGDSGSGVYKVYHDAIPADSSATGEIIPAVDDYRYYGASPNNYVCLDMNGESTCPDRSLFRMIGSIYEENAGQNLIKVIKATPLSDGTTSSISWNCIVDGSGLIKMQILDDPTISVQAVEEPTKCDDRDNLWKSAAVNELLNEIYLSNGSAKYYNNNSSTTTVNFSNIGITINAQKLINSGRSKNDLSRYYLGGYSSTSQKTNDIYMKERSNVTISGSANYWNGTVGLIYASDYGYAAGKKCVIEENIKSNTYSCNSNNWLSSTNTEWTISSSSESQVWVINTIDDNTYLYNMYASGNIWAYDYGDLLGIVRPTFYLSSDVVITSGTGTSSDPYIVSK